MQVSKANVVVDDAPSPKEQTWYAPLYLSTSLRDVAFDLEELEHLALSRLRLLKAVTEGHAPVHQGTRKWETLPLARQSARAAERQHGIHVGSGPARDDGILKDEASHFVLRLALCGTHEHRTWFLNSECELFASRLEGSPPLHILQAVRQFDGPRVEAVSREELDGQGGRLRRELDDVMRGSCWSKEGAQRIRFFRVAFEQVPSLVRARRVLLRDGIAYVPQANILDVVIGLFRAKLNQSMTQASKAVFLADNDRRMRPILDSVRAHHAASEQSSKKFDTEQNAERISLNELQESLPSMPLCMQNMMAQLRQHHHLRHAARMQLGVFLMGCGLTMEESLRFWRMEFGRGSIDSSKFEKTYSYNIRHFYGKEGKRQVLRPKDCMKVINERPGPGEYHGCPYREFEENMLSMAIRKLGVDNEAAKNITAKAKEGHFQIACGMCFKSSQPATDSEDATASFIPTHPNEYFIEARRRRFSRNSASQAVKQEETDEDLPLQYSIESQPDSQPTPMERSKENSSAPPLTSDAKPDETVSKQNSDGPSTAIDIMLPETISQPMEVVKSTDSAAKTSGGADDEQTSKRLCTEGNPDNR